MTTIFALASAPGRAGIAVVRLSGPSARDALFALTGLIAKPWRARRARFVDPQTKELLDDGIALFFAAPRSFTGEDVAELHVHGGGAVVAAVLGALGGLPGLRLAEPGEFTRRAFENGKLDLTAAEGMADLVAADTAAQRRQAQRQLSGELGRLYEAWRQRLLRALARLEAEIEFPEESLPSYIWEESRRDILNMVELIQQHLADNHRGERLREGVVVAILGPPNAGKSSLMNALARRDVAITSAVAGTTRDVVEVSLDLGGFPVVLADTAGLRFSADAVEAEGVRRARQRAGSADLRLLVVDVTKPAEGTAVAELLGPDAILIANKTDLGGEARWVDDLAGGRALRLSVTSGAGLPELLRRLEQEVAVRFAAGHAPLITRLRHREALTNCTEALQRFTTGRAPELAVEDLRIASRYLGRITGRVDVEELLDIVFREFCIGK